MTRISNSSPDALSVSQPLLDRLRETCEGKALSLIAIGGFGGSGKSTLADRIAANLDATVVQGDNFYEPELGHADLGRIRLQVLEPLSRDRIARYQRFDWDRRQLADWVTVPPHGVVIIEGVMMISPELLPYYHFSIWVDCPQEIAFRRGLARDRDVYGVDTREQWLHRWMPQERTYVETYRPSELADFVLDASADTGFE